MGWGMLFSGEGQGCNKALKAGKIAKDSASGAVQPNTSDIISFRLQHDVPVQIFDLYLD
jgi:hypothetical protein